MGFRAPRQMSNGHTEHCGIGSRRLGVDVRPAVDRDPTVTVIVVALMPIGDLVGGRILESEDRTTNALPPLTGDAHVTRRNACPKPRVLRSYHHG